MKILKPVKAFKINREIKILQTLKDGTNIIKLLDIVLQSLYKTPAIIFERVNNKDFRTLYPSLSTNDIK